MFLVEYLNIVVDGASLEQVSLGSFPGNLRHNKAHGASGEADVNKLVI